MDVLLGTSTKPHQTGDTNASHCSGVCEFLRIAFSLLVPLSLRYLIDYVERAELAALAAAATVTGAGGEEATWEWENSTAEGGGGGIPNQGRPDRCRIVSNRLIRLINAKRRVAGRKWNEGSEEGVRVDMCCARDEAGGSRA